MPLDGRVPADQLTGVTGSVLGDLFEAKCTEIS